MKRNVFAVLVLLLTLCVAVFFTSNMAAAGTDVVKIGFNAPLSGPAAAWGLVVLSPVLFAGLDADGQAVGLVG